MRQRTCRLIASILIFVLMLAFAGCKSGTKPTDPSTTPTGATEQTQGTTVSETSIPETSVPETTVPETTVPATTVPETTAPPETTTPVTQPPETQPPVTQPAPTVSPEPVYEYGDHYAHILNYSPGPEDHTHVYWGPGGTGKFYEGEYIFDVDYRTITYELWCSWDPIVQLAFRNCNECDSCSDVQMTPDESYHYLRIVEYNNYTCGYENHYCKQETNHIYLMRWMAEGCKYCGKTDCVSFFARSSIGFTSPDGTLCPEYDIYRDPDFYCQDCGRPTYKINPDRTQHCFSYIHSTNCHYCGVWVEARACHTCKQEDIDAFQANNN